MLTSIDVKDVKEMKGCSASQTFSKWRMSPFELSSCCSCYVFSQKLDFLRVKRGKCSAIFAFTTKTTQPRLQVFSVNG